MEEINAFLAKENTSLGEADPSLLSVPTEETNFGKFAENLSRPNYAMAQGVSAAIKGEPILPAMKKGFSLQEPKVFGEVIEENMPYSFTSPTTSAVIQTVGGLALDIALDPLTYAGGVGGRLLKQGGRALKYIEKNSDLAVDLGRLFSNDVGSAAHREAYEVLRKYENIKHSRTGHAVEDMVQLDKRVTKLAKDTGEDPHLLRARIVDNVENRLKGDNVTVNEIVSYISDRNAAALAKEQKLGLRIGEVIKESSGVDYFIHAITPSGRKWLGKHGGKEFRGMSRVMTDQHASMVHRNFGNMTIDEVNQWARKKGFDGEFFMRDPARGQAIRDLRHARAVTGAEFYDEMGARFGTKEAAEELMEVKPERLKGLYFEPDVARIIDLHHEAFVNPKEVNRFLRHYDDAQNWWKRWTLAVFPAYHTRNMMGNFWNNSLAGVRTLKPYREALAVQTGKKGALKTATGSIDYEDVLQLAHERGVMGRGFYGGDVPSAVDDALMKGKWWTLSSKNKLVRGGMKTGRAIEENARLAHFTDKLSKGMSPDDAARSVKKFLFDYTELTPFEQNVMKRTLPFYSWSRKNLPLQAEMFLRRPGQQMLPIKLKHEIERLSEDDIPPPEANIAEFLSGDYAIRVGGRTPTKDAQGREMKTGTFPYMPLAGYLPWGDLPRWSNNPVETFTYMVSPLLKEPIQQVANYDLFFRRKIYNPELEQSVVIPTGKQEFTRFLGVRLSPRAAHALRNIRLLATIDRANPFQVFGEDRVGMRELGSGQKLAQYLLGIRNYNMDEVKGVVYGVSKEKRKIKDLKRDLYFLGREMRRVKDPKIKQDITDRINMVTDAINRISREEIPKHIRR
jgi:hypothetical protein